MNMKILSFSFFVTLCLPMFGQSEKNQSLTIIALQNELKRADSNNVTRIEVFYFPEEIETEFAISPADLEESYWAKTTIANVKESKLGSTFLHLLSESNIQIRNGGARDIRWGCVFFDSKNTRLVSLYFDRIGYGEVNGIQIESNRKILDLLREKFAFR